MMMTSNGVFPLTISVEYLVSVCEWRDFRHSPRVKWDPVKERNSEAVWWTVAENCFQFIEM